MNVQHSPRTRRVLAGAALATAGVLVALSLPSAAVAADGDAVIDIYDVNDFHGRIAQSLSTPAPRDGDAAGAAVLAGALDQLRGDDPSTSAFVSAGDNIGASTFESFIQQDQPTIDVLNAMDLSVSAIGNHELDQGRTDLEDRVIGSADSRNAKWDYISANIVDKATGKPAFDPYSIQEISGERVGFIGATVDLDGLVSPAGIDTLEMADITDSVNRVATQLTDDDESNDEADVLVLLVHDGAESASATDLDNGSDFARAVHEVSPRVSAILSGHTHQTYVHSVVPEGGTVARPVIQTGSYGFNLGHLQLTVAADGSVTATAAENIRLVDGTFAPDADVAATVASAVQQADVLGAVELGTTDADMRRAVQTDGSENRGGESTLGNFVAEVQRSATEERQGAQIAFMNPGGLRADLAGGPVTYKEAAVVQPFANTLVVLDLTGSQIKEALEQQWQPAGLSRPFLKLGASEGFSYTYDPLAASGSRITSMSLDGTPIDAATTYKVTVNSFLASGGDNFTAFAGAAAKQDSGKVDLEAQVEYFEEHPDVAVAGDQRSVGVTMTPTPDGGFQAGHDVAIALSSLVFSNAADQPTSVQVSAGGTQLASDDIDPTIVDTTDEQGTATLRFTVPVAVPTTGAPARALAGTTLAAAAPVATTDEPLVVTFGTTRIVLPVTIPVAAAVDPTDPTDPGTPGTGGGTGDGTGSDGGTGTVGTPAAARSSNGALAYTGAELAAPAVVAGLLLLAGITVAVIARRKRAQRETEVQAD